MALERNLRNPWGEEVLREQESTVNFATNELCHSYLSEEARDAAIQKQTWNGVGEALYSQQKQDRELTVAQIMNSLLPNSDLNWRK